MEKFIVAAPPLTGEVSPLLQLAHGLSGRGHRVTVVTGSRFRADAERTGLRFVPVSGKADFDERLIGDDPVRRSLAPGPEMLNYDWIRYFVDPVGEQHAILQRLLEADPDQSLLSNAQWFGAFPVALGAPGLRPRRWVSVTAAALPLSSRDTTFFGPAPIGPGEDQRAANEAANAAFAATMRPAHDRLEHLLRGLGATQRLPPIFDSIVTVPQVATALSVPGFEFERSDAPASLHLVGALPGLSMPDWQPPEWWGELDGSRPVVLVTQGTLANRDLSELVEPTLLGLADLDVTVVAALGREASALQIPVPHNARVVELIPFGALLAKTDVFVTNGGLGGTQQAIAAGVPTIAAGATEDKPAVAARVAHHGLGIDLHTGRPSPEMIAAAVETVLADGETHDRVRALARVYAAHDPLDEIERLLTTPAAGAQG